MLSLPTTRHVRATTSSTDLDIRELGKNHIICGGMEGSKLPIKVGKTHKRSEEDLSLYSWSLERRKKGGQKEKRRKR